MQKLLYAMSGAGILAAVIFQVGLDPRVAGLIAGSGFIAVGIMGIAVSWPERRRHRFSLAILAFSVLHLIGVALPMIGFRLMNWNEPFSKIAVWGLSGPEFHQISTRVYALWFFVVLVAYFYERKLSRGTRQGNKIIKPIP